MGDDFAYQDALSYFANLDKLIAGFELFPQTSNNRTIRALYSTPACYIKAVNDEAQFRGITFPTKTDDFFPYASDPHAYWTGYFTSRPTHKRMERSGNNILQVAKQLSSFAKQNNSMEDIVPLQQVMGVMQHHDAITGTEKQHVADDYAKLLTAAMEKSFRRISNLLSDNFSARDLNLQSCLLANVSVCNVSQSGDFIMAVYNPLGQTVSTYIQLPVEAGTFEVVGSSGQINYQITSSIDNFNHLAHMKPAMYNLVFLAEDIPPLGASLYKVKRTGISKSLHVEDQSKEKSFKLGSEEFGFTIDEVSGYLNSIIINRNIFNITQELMYYIGARGTNAGYNARASGAYVFRPSPDFPNALRFDPPAFTILKGDIVDEVHQSFSDYSKQIIRVYKNASYIEFDWLIGPIDVSDNQSREVISRFATDIQSGDVFYTDSNGREMIKRKTNHRETYNYTDEEPVSGNYYPVTSRIMIKSENDDYHLSVLTDRSQGGSSLESGQIELMLHRRLLNDDNFGLEENLYEEQFGQGSVVRGQHYIVMGSASNDFAVRSLVIQKHLAPLVLLASPGDISIDELWSGVTHEFSGLKRDLPKGLHLLTLEQWKDSEDKLLIRLEHILEKDENVKLSQQLEVNLADLFTYFKIVELQEMTLDGLLPIEENERLRWTTNTSRLNPEKSRGMDSDDTDEAVVVVNPMQIRTFIATVKYEKVNK